PGKDQSLWSDFLSLGGRPSNIDTLGRLQFNFELATGGLRHRNYASVTVLFNHAQAFRGSGQEAARDDHGHTPRTALVDLSREGELHIVFTSLRAGLCYGGRLGSRKLNRR